MFCFLKELRRQAASLILNFISATKFNSNFLNETMGKTACDAYRYSYAVVLVVGILGNILVIISILRQKKLLKNNYTTFLFYILQYVIWEHRPLYFSILSRRSPGYYFHQVLCFLLHISRFSSRRNRNRHEVDDSVLRYRATVHPLKPDVSRRKLKVVCGLVYIVGFIAGYATCLPLCFMQRNEIVYYKVLYGYTFSCLYFFPTIFMAVVYYKIGRELIKQNRYMKSECSNPVRRSAPDSNSFIS